MSKVSQCRFPGLVRHRLGLAVSMVVPALLLAAQAGWADPKARVTPSKIDLGVIEEGGKFDRTIELTNVGDGLLVLEDVKTSCGCTAAAVEGGSELGPGESRQIDVSFSSKNMEGDIKKKVTVYTNDPERRTTEVLITANVHRPVRWEPKYVTLSRVSQSEDFEQTISIQADENLDMQIQDAFVLGGRMRDKPSKIFELEPLGTRVEDGRNMFDYAVRMPAGNKPQKISEMLVVVTNLPADRDTLKIPIRGEIVGRIKVYPEFAVLPIINPGEEAVKDVTLTATEGTFNVVSARVDNSPVEIEIVPQNEGRQTLVRLRYVGEEAGTNGVRTLHIETDDENQKVIEVPVRYHTKAAQTKTAGQKS